MNRKLGLKGLCHEEMVLKEAQIHEPPFSFRLQKPCHLSLRAQTLKLPFPLSYFPLWSFAPSPYSTLQLPLPCLCQISHHFDADSSGEVSMALDWAWYSLTVGHSSSKMACSLDVSQFLFCYSPSWFHHMVLRDMKLEENKCVPRHSCLRTIKAENRLL